MIDLEVIETKDIPKSPLDWHEGGYSYNTIFITLHEPNPMTDECYAEVSFLYSGYGTDGTYYARDLKNNEVLEWYCKGVVKRKYRDVAIRLDYGIFRRKYRATEETREHFLSIDKLKEFILREEEILSIKRSIAPLYDKGIARVSYKGTV